MPKKTYEPTVRDWLWEFKKKAQCSRCGFSHPAALQFHHPDPTVKEAAISEMSMSYRSLGKLQDEIAKCEVICANCHFIHHYNERQEQAAVRLEEEAAYQELLEYDED